MNQLLMSCDFCEIREATWLNELGVGICGTCYEEKTSGEHRASYWPDPPDPEGLGWSWVGLAVVGVSFVCSALFMVALVTKIGQALR